jgi:four helix bundle protein
VERNTEQTSIPRVGDLRERLMNFSLFVIQGLESLRLHPEGKYLVGQLFRSATSVGANYEEAKAAESRADFIHKMHVALKEVRETAYWLRLSDKAGWFEKSWREQAMREADELMLILGKAVVTAKRNRTNNAPNS